MKTGVEYEHRSLMNRTSGRLEELLHCYFFYP